MKKSFITLVSVLSLSACASVIDHQTQEITMRTPGAENARCIIQNEDLKYVAYTDQKIEIMKSPHDLVIHCKAGGNREQTVHVKREVNDWVFLNVANGFVPGATYDYFSRGAFLYPDVFTVSFAGVPVKPYPLPEHLRNDYGTNEQNNRIEYYGPTVIETEDSRNNPPRALQRKQRLYENFNLSNSSAAPSISRQYNPSIYGTGSSYDPTEEDK